jgi:hypothetical protein
MSLFIVPLPQWLRRRVSPRTDWQKSSTRLLRCAEGVIGLNCPVLPDVSSSDISGTMEWFLMDDMAFRPANPRNATADDL